MLKHSHLNKNLDEVYIKNYIKQYLKNTIAAIGAQICQQKCCIEFLDTQNIIQIYVFRARTIKYSRILKSLWHKYDKIHRRY